MGLQIGTLKKVAFRMLRFRGFCGSILGLARECVGQDYLGQRPGNRPLCSKNEVLGDAAAEELLLLQEKGALSGYW